MKKTLLICPLLAGTALLATSSFLPANAAFTISAGGSTPGDGSFLTTSNPNATVVTFDSAIPAGYTYSGGGIVTNGGSHAAPANDSTLFYSVGPSTSTPGTITISGLQQYFGLYWGSIDTYNSIEFFNGTTSVGSFSGTNIAALLPSDVIANGDQGDILAPASNVYLNFYADSSSYFDKIVLTSTQNAFESDNHAFQAVPEPLTILGSAIALGFGTHVRRKLRRNAR